MNFLSQHSAHSLKKAATVLLILVYALGAVEFKGIHEAFHNEDHSEAQEKNPCHRSLYHQAADACDHAFHFSQQKQCLLCHLVTHSDAWMAAEALQVLPVCHTTAFSAHDYYLPAEYPLTRAGRGPPALT